MATCIWTGASNKRYEYEIHGKEANFNAIPGNYIFAKMNAANQWQAIYAGETEDLSTRFDNHHQQPCIDRQGATHIHVRVNYNGVEARRDEEEDIRRGHNPPCNQQ